MVLLQRSQEKNNINEDLNAVQRGDPEMANKVFRFVERCSSLEENPIISIHDQGLVVWQMLLEKYLNTKVLKYS